MLCWILGYLFIDWFWKPLVWCVYVHVDSLTRMCSYASVFLWVTWKWLTNFPERSILITLHTRFLNWTTGNILSKEAWKADNFQKKWKHACLALVLKRRKLWKSKAIDKVTPETNNCIYWKIFPYLFAGMWISVLKKIFFFFLISSNLKRFSI